MEKIIEFWNEYKNKIIASVIFFVVTIMLFWGVYFFNTMKAKADSISFEDTEESENHSSSSSDTTTSNISGNKIKIDIKGEVKTPGVYELSEKNRVIDAIKKAGGLSSKADTSSINLSKKLYDEMVIVIYSKEEVKNIIETKKEEVEKNEKCRENDNKVENNACVDDNSNNSENKQITSKNDNQGKININTASLDELETLSGIGESKARSIIDYRSENGKFEKIEDIKNVNGIGESLFEKIKNNITI